MIRLLEEHNNTAAYLYNNIILLPDTLEIAGIILGNCIFGKSGESKGKYFNQTLYATSGRIIARKGSFIQQELNSIEIFRQAWELIQSIKDHQCPWVTPKTKWFHAGIAEVLR